MNWTGFDSWIVVTAALCAVACALPGCFLVLRRMSMMGDAISHAVLPGLAVAFLVSESRASFAMFAGAVTTGVLTAVFTQWVSRFGNVDRGAAMGIVFTTLFALGLLLIVQAADRVDLDPACVLYGAIELTPLDTVQIARTPFEAPRAALVLAGVLSVNVVLIVALFKELRLSAFDAELSDTLGFSSGAMHYLLMIMVAVTTVASFEAVGSIIVIAMLVAPPATALLLTHRLVPMLVVAVFAAIAAAVLGHIAALKLPPFLGFESTSTSGMMAATSGALFVLAWLFSPAQGLVPGWIRRALRGAEDQPPSTPSPPAG